MNYILQKKRINDEIINTIGKYELWNFMFYEDFLNQYLNEWKEYY